MTERASLLEFTHYTISPLVPWYSGVLCLRKEAVRVGVAWPAPNPKPLCLEQRIKIDTEVTLKHE